MILPIPQPLHSFIFSPQMIFYIHPQLLISIIISDLFITNCHNSILLASRIHCSDYQLQCFQGIPFNNITTKKSSNTLIYLSFSLHHSIRHIITLISLSLESIICNFNHYLAHTLNSLNILSCHCTQQEKNANLTEPNYSYRPWLHTQVI